MSKSDQPIVYLAHAFEDKEDLARPLANYLRESGVDVWLDEWSIGPGDSIRQKMDEGLESCTHFLVLLTPISNEKEWVKVEIDAAFNAHDCKQRFMAVRSGLDVAKLSRTLKTKYCPEIDIKNGDDLKSLVGDIFGKSRKPPLGPKPNYVNEHPPDLGDFSMAVFELARHLITTSKYGRKFDPRVRESELPDLLGMSGDDISDAVQDLEDAGLVQRSATIGSDEFWPNSGLFVKFDAYFLKFNPKDDARTIAVRLPSLEGTQVNVDELHKEKFSDWSVRRMNGALNCLEELDVINAISTLGCRPYPYGVLCVTKKTRRFARQGMA